MGRERERGSIKERESGSETAGERHKERGIEAEREGEGYKWREKGQRWSEKRKEA